MKKTVSLLLTLLLALGLAVPALALTQSEDFYVTDEAGVLSRETVEHVLDVNADLEESCGGAQVVVVLVKYLDDIGADEYATGLFNDWQLSPPRHSSGGLPQGRTRRHHRGHGPGRPLHLRRLRQLSGPLLLGRL